MCMIRRPKPNCYTIVICLAGVGWLASSCRVGPPYDSASTVAGYDLSATKSPSPQAPPTRPSTSKATATSTTTPSPTSTPTPFGGTGLEFIYTDWQWNLTRYGQGPVLTKQPIETAIGWT